MNPVSLEDGVGFRLSRVARIRRSRWAEQLRSLGLTPAQASILRGAKDHSKQSLRSLARTLGTDAMSVKRCVDELETRGLLNSASAPDDRRPRIVNLTKSGIRLATQLEEMVAKHEANLKSLFSLHEYGQLLVVLDRLEQGLQIVESGNDPKIEKGETR
jgi:DNA-binding MarR family transcriptional regulator